MNSRQKRRFRSYGLTLSETIEVGKELKTLETNARKGHCSYMDYKVTNSLQKEIINRAKSLGFWGTHVGSKPLYKIWNRILRFEKQLNQYTSIINALKSTEESEKNDN